MAVKNIPRKTAIQQATCAAILAASFAAPLPADASTAVQGATCASILAGSCVALQSASVQFLQQYCTSSWRKAGVAGDDWDDCTQEAMLELLSRLPQHRIERAIEDPGSTERRELMRCIWCVTQRWRRTAAKRPVSLDSISEQVASRGEGQTVDRDFDLEKLRSAMGELSPMQQQILDLMRQGDSVADIAQQLNLPAARVSDQKYKAVRKIQRTLAG